MRRSKKPEASGHVVLQGPCGKRETLGLPWEFGKLAGRVRSRRNFVRIVSALSYSSPRHPFRSHSHVDLLNRCPSHTVGDFLASRILRILLPGMIERFTEDRLPMLGNMVLNRDRQIDV